MLSSRWPLIRARWSRASRPSPRLPGVSQKAARVGHKASQAVYCMHIDLFTLIASTEMPTEPNAFSNEFKFGLVLVVVTRLVLRAITLIWRGVRGMIVFGGGDAGALDILTSGLAWALCAILPIAHLKAWYGREAQAVDLLIAGLLPATCYFLAMGLLLIFAKFQDQSLSGLACAGFFGTAAICPVTAALPVFSPGAAERAALTVFADLRHASQKGGRREAVR